MKQNERKKTTNWIRESDMRGSKNPEFIQVPHSNIYKRASIRYGLKPAHNCQQGTAG